MISPISFKSTYVVTNSNNTPEKINKVQSLENKSELKGSPVSIYRKDKESFIGGKYRYSAQVNIIADDGTDNLIETFLKQNNIQYKKKTKKSLYDARNILKRMRVPNDLYNSCRYVETPININTERFEELFKNSDQYVGNYYSMNENSKKRYDNFLEYIKSDMPINMPEVYVEVDNGCPSVSFQDGRHRYVVLRDMGFKYIPVAMNFESFKNAVSNGLIFY